MNTAYPQMMIETQAAPATRSGSSEGSYGAPLWEQALLALWFYYTFIIRPGNELVMYPMSLYWMCAFMVHRRQMVPLAFRSWLIFAIPILAILSWAWAPMPSQALRFGVMMTLGAMVAVYVAARFAPHEIIRAVFFAGLISVIQVAPEMGHFGNKGPWGEKNIFAVRMVVIMLAAMATAFNRHEISWLRLIAFPLIPVCFVFIIIAQSATSLVFGAGSILAMTTIWLFWSRFSRIRHLRTAFLIMLLFGALSTLYVLANTGTSGIYENFLDSLGKDATLTGRTMLWDAADRITKERPMLGVGAEGFWLWQRGDASTLLELSYKQAGTKFSFHNSYLEMQIHFGYVGLVLTYLAVFWCLWRSVLSWFATQSIVRSFFLLITGIVFVSTFTESWLYVVFDTSVTLFYVSAISSLVRQQSRKEEEREQMEYTAMHGGEGAVPILGAE
ncbi:MAG: O-antigen ligase family protein [Hyphomonadaceae bacterium]|nr:O-antigen ligase family protein [Hyphomonadaceae bacterium]